MSRAFLLHTPEQTPSAPGSADLIRLKTSEVRSRLETLDSLWIVDPTELKDQILSCVGSLAELVTMLAVRIEQLQAPQPSARLHELQEALQVEGNEYSRPHIPPGSNQCPSCGNWYQGSRSNPASNQAFITTGP